MTEIEVKKESDTVNRPGFINITDKLQPSWKNEPRIEDLKKDYQDALADFERIKSKIDNWELYRNGGPKVNPSKPGKSTVRPKLIRKQQEWKYPSLEEPFLSSDNMFKIYPRTADDTETAKQNEIVLNYQFDVLIDKPKLIGDIVRTLVDTGTCFVKVGWESEYKTVVEYIEKPVYASGQEAYNYLQEKLQKGEITEQEVYQLVESGQPVQVGVEKVKIVREVPVVNQPKYEVCNTKSVIVDPTCEGDIRKAMFVIHEYQTSLAELKKQEYKRITIKEKTVDENGNEIEIDVIKEEGIYKNLDKIQVDSEDFDSYKDPNISFKFSDPDRKKIKAYDYWGYWDIYGNGELVPILATWVGNTLIRLEENPFPFKHPPFAVAQYIPVTGSVYGESDAELMKENQDIIGKMTRAALDIIGSQAVGQKFIHSQVLKDPIAKTNYENGRDVIYSGNIAPKDAIYVTNVEPPSPVIFDIINMQQKEAESLSGTVAFHQGISGSALGSTATSVRSALDAVSKRELSILRRINALLKDMAIMTIEMNRVYLPDEFFVRVTGDNYVKVKRDMLQGQIDIKVEVSTAERDNERAQELAFMLQTIGNNASPSLVAKVMAKIARLRKMPDLAKQIEEEGERATQPDPMQQQLQQMQLQQMQLQMEMLQKQMAEIDAKTLEKLSRTRENRYADTLVKKAKAAKEVLAAKKLQSEIDKLDLDTAEKATGADIQKDMVKKEHENQIQQLIRENEILKKMLQNVRDRIKGDSNGLTGNEYQ